MVKETLEEALSKGNPRIVNPDQGAQFTSTEFTNRLIEASIEISMDGVGRATNNAFIERLWRTVKYEDVYLKEYTSVDETYTSLNRCFKYYDYDRPHQGLGSKTQWEVYRPRRKRRHVGCVPLFAPQFDELFVSAENLVVDQEAFQKRLASDSIAISALRDFRTILAAADSMGHDALEPQLKQFVEQRGIKLGVCISALRIAVTGKSNGLGIFDYFEVLGKPLSQVLFDHLNDQIRRLDGAHRRCLWEHQLWNRARARFLIQRDMLGHILAW